MKIRPDHAAGRVNLAIALGHLGQADEAKREFEEAVKTDRAMERARVRVMDAIRENR